MTDESAWHFGTRVIHAGQTPGEWQGATLPPIHQSVSHRFDTARGLSDAFAGKTESFIYMRMRNPTNQALENKLAQLEGGVGAVVTSSGMAAVADTVLAIVSGESEIVAGKSLFMSTYLVFANVLSKFSVTTKLVETTDADQFERAITEKSKLIFVETIGNPKIDVPDIAAIAQIAHRHGIPLVVDNTLASPYLIRPIEHGADVVVHSLTKFFNGHGSAIGGAIVDSGNWEWSDAPFLEKVWRESHVSLGTTAAPMHSFLTMIGLDTLALRMARHQSNAQKLAEFLDAHNKVRWVNYPGLEGSPSHATAARQFGGRGYGALLTFGLADQEACFTFIDNVKLANHLANLGDSKTLVIHPYSSQYVSFTREKRDELGIEPEMIRVSIGIEHPDDIIGDFEQALEAV